MDGRFGVSNNSRIKAGMLEDWIIIDCATSRPATRHSDPKLWHAHFEHDYSHGNQYLVVLGLPNNTLNRLKHHHPLLGHVFRHEFEENTAIIKVLPDHRH